MISSSSAFARVVDETETETGALYSAKCSI
jgi:hypothetical protein